MALYDNKHWLLSHIRNSFISSDDTGMCEMVMAGEDIPRKLSGMTKFDCYPGVDESDDEESEMDVMGQSFDIQSDIDFGIHRQRSSTAQRLEKMDQDRKKTNRIKHVKWEWSPVVLTDEERAGLFERKNFRQNTKDIHIKKLSLLSEQLEKCPNLPQNPFVEYAKYDGNAQIGVPTRKYGIFLTMLETAERNYPMHVVVLAQAKVQDLIGLICWKYTLEHGQHKLKDSVDHYGLYIAEDDGEVDWDFPCLDPRETVGKFGFNYLALVERQKKDEDSKSVEREETEVVFSQEALLKPKSQQQDLEDLIRMQGHMIAMEAPLYQSYRVYIINKVRAKTEIHLGESLKYDSTFKGPLHKRSCTDVICLLLFICFIGAWIAVGIYAFMHGDPARLLIVTDSEGRRCGLDDEVRDKPSLFYFDLTKCAVQNVIINGCPTPQVCVEKCPTENFAFMERGSDWRSKMICKEGVILEDESDAERKIKENHCAGYYLQSKEVYGHCLPGAIDTQSQELQGFLSKTAGELEDVVLGQMGVVNILIQTKELGQKIVQDLSDSWPFIIGGLGLAMLLCLIYIVLMRWFAGIMVWLSLIGVIALLSYCCYASYVKYDEMKTAEENANSSTVQENSRHLRSNLFKPVEEQLDEILAMKDTWLAFLIISAVLLVVVLLLLIFLRSRIRIAIALIKEASKAVGSITSTLIFPLFPWFLQLFVIGWFLAVFLFLAGLTQPVYKAQMDDNCTCYTSIGTYKTGDKCDPRTFAACLNSCHTAVCQFFSYEKEKYVDYLQAFNIFGIFWGLFFVSALGEMILAATFATWYWTFNKSDVPFFALTVSIGRTFRYHLGTIAFGSLILAICRLIRVILEYINHKLKKYDNAFVKAVMCCLRCFFWCLEKFIKFINKNAYIMCAIHGKNFCRSAKDAFNLLMRNVVRVFVLDKVADFLLFLGKLMITAGMCALSFFMFTKKLEYIDYVQVPMLNYSIVPVLIIGFGTYFIASIFFGVYEMAVDTLFLCFLEDCERNDGSREKPYFMSKDLMKILHKRNK